MDLGGGFGEPLDVDDPRAHILALDGRLQRHQDVRAFLQKIAELAQALLKQDRLISSGGIRELHDAELAAVPRPPFIAVEHAARPEPPGQLAVAHSSREVSPAPGLQALERRVIDFERMTGEEEADGIKLDLSRSNSGQGAARALIGAAFVAPNSAFCSAAFCITSRLAIASVGSIAAKAAARLRSRQSGGRPPQGSRAPSC